MINDRLRRILDADYEKWKISPSGVIVALARFGSYTNARIMVGVDGSGYSHTF